MERAAKDAQAGDIFVIKSERIASAVTLGGSTFLSWRHGRRATDIVDPDDEIPNVLPWRCPSCQTPIVSLEWDSEAAFTHE